MALFSTGRRGGSSKKKWGKGKGKTSPSVTFKSSDGYSGTGANKYIAKRNWSRTRRVGMEKKERETEEHARGEHTRHKAATQPSMRVKKSASSGSPPKLSKPSRATGDRGVRAAIKRSRNNPRLKAFKEKIAAKKAARRKKSK